MATEHLWDVKHDYYCSETCFFTNKDLVTRYRSWAEFFAAEGDNAPYYNLLFRWDWRLANDDGEDKPAPDFDDNYRGYVLSMFWMIQRKGYHRTTEVEVCRNDEPEVHSFLERHWRYVAGLWAPISGLPSLDELPPAADTV